jgi:catechol 2,3-dioxygenase
VPAGTTLGHVHLEVTDLERMARFCGEAFGMKIRARQTGAVFLAWGDYHHHVAANIWRRRSQPLAPDALGLVAIGSALASSEEMDALADRARQLDGIRVDADEDVSRIVGPDGFLWEFEVGKST